MWEAVVFGAVVGLACQYIEDVIYNIQDGKTGSDMFKPTSSVKDYFASAAGGALAAIPCSGLLGTMAVGALGNVASNFIKGNIQDGTSLVKNAAYGAFANGIGYGISKGIAALHVKHVNSMPRNTKKLYLKEKVFNCRQKYVNKSLKIFNQARFTQKMAFIERRSIYRAGIFSTLTSSSLLLNRQRI